MTTLKLREVRTGSGTSTDGSTKIALATFDIATGGPGGTALVNCSIFVTARCSGHATDDTAAGEWIGGCFKVVAGTLSQVSTSTHAIAMLKDTGGAPNSDFDVTIPANVITYYVTGVVGKTIDWFGGMEIYVNQPT